MSLFTRKHPAHQLTASTNGHRIVYTCTVCSRNFYDQASASWQYSREWCPGKYCHDSNYLQIPAHLIRGDKLKQERRNLREGQEPVAYLCFTMITQRSLFLARRLPQAYIPLYDIRECIALDGAVPLPELA